MLRSHEVDLYFRISALCHTAYTLRQLLPTGASCGSLQRGSNLSLQSLVQKSSCWVNHRPRWAKEVSIESEVKTSLVVKGHENVVDFRPDVFGQVWARATTGRSYLQNLESASHRGIFYMDAMECKHVAELLSPSMACANLSEAPVSCTRSTLSLEHLEPRDNIPRLESDGKNPSSKVRSLRSSKWTTEAT